MKLQQILSFVWFHYKMGFTTKVPVSMKLLDFIYLRYKYVVADKGFPTILSVITESDRNILLIMTSFSENKSLYYLQHANMFEFQRFFQW